MPIWTKPPLCSTSIIAIGVRHVGELIELMGGTAKYDSRPDQGREPQRRRHVDIPSPGDMNEVMGQETAKWALRWRPQVDTI